MQKFYIVLRLSSFITLPIKKPFQNMFRCLEEISEEAEKDRHQLCFPRCRDISIPFQGGGYLSIKLKFLLW